MMKISPIQNPFPHIIIEDFFTDEELKLVWNELFFLVPKMKPPSETSAAKNERGLMKKNGSGVFLDNFFTNPENSDILLYTRKLMHDDVKRASTNLGLYFDLYPNIGRGTTLVQLYKNGDFYSSHVDSFVFSAVILLHKSPKRYEGGDFYFPKYDYTPQLKNNCAIIFPSIVDHEVTEVILNSKNVEDFRFTITHFLSM